jgi:hypothetical protein
MSFLALASGSTFPGLIKKLVVPSSANACFFAQDFLGRIWACVIMVGYCQNGERL